MANENTLVKSIRLVGMHEITEFSVVKIIRRVANKLFYQVFQKIANYTFNCRQRNIIQKTMKRVFKFNKRKKNVQ